MSHACVRTANGEVWCWGHGDSGELGDGRRGYAFAPRQVPLPQKAIKLTSGDPRCAILEGGVVACWGGWSKAYGDHNAVGVQTFNLTDIVSVSSPFAHGSHRYFLRRDGTVFEVDGSRPPVAIPSLSGAEEIMQGTDDVCARMKDKSVRCWSDKPTPRIVTPSRAGKKKDTPVSAIPPPPPDPSQRIVPALRPMLAGAISLGEECAVLADRTVRCWGDNTGGQLGDGSSVSRPQPGPAVAGVTNAAMVSRGSYAACAVLTDGSAKCWGDSTEYPLIPGAPRRLHASAVPIPLKGIAELHVSIHHACARLTDGRVACWGRNQFSELGDGSKDLERPEPSFVIGFGRPSPAQRTKEGDAPARSNGALVTTAQDVSAGGSTTCARMTDGTPRCWGKNADGQLGDGTRDNRSRPVAIPYLSTVTMIRPGNNHTCAIGAQADDGAVFCWGFGLIGELGQGNEDSQRVPVRVPGLTGVKQISMAGFSCALLADGSVKCWGDYDSGAGDPAPSGSKSPTLVNGATGLVEIATTGSGGCGRTAAGDVKCFGWGSLRELSGGRTPKRTAMPVRGVTRAKALAGGGGGFCAVVEPASGSGGNVLCWGSGVHDALDIQHVVTADGTWNVWAPVRAKGYDRVLDLAIGGDGSCARTEAKELACFRDKKSIAAPAMGLRDVVKVTYGEAHACALLGNGEVHCWGKNDAGQLGDGTTTDRAQPVRVAF